MKNTNKCPKCQSTDIVRFDGYTGAYGTGNNVMTGKTVFSTVNVNRYICCQCGYTEEWIDKEDIEKITSSKRAKRQKNEKASVNTIEAFLRVFHTHIKSIISYGEGVCKEKYVKSGKFLPFKQKIIVIFLQNTILQNRKTCDIIQVKKRRTVQ